MNEIISIIIIPVLTGLLLFFVPEKLRTFKAIVSLLISILIFYLTIIIYRADVTAFKLNEIFGRSGINVFGLDILQAARKYLTFNSDNLSKLIILFISIFAVLILLYSIAYIN